MENNVVDLLRVVYRRAAVVEPRIYYGNSGDEERLPLNAVTKRLMKTVTMNTGVCVCDSVVLSCEGKGVQ